MPTLAAAEVECFRSIIARRLGLSFDATKEEFLADLLRRRANATGPSPAVYLGLIDSKAAPVDELRILAQELTVAETYFFRNIEQFRAFDEIALPERLAARGPAGRVAILSAGCASGEEPYSLAILAHERGLTSKERVSILGVDINPRMLEKAATARYAPWSLRETPPEILRNWFRASGREFILDPGIQSTVSFAERNLAFAGDDLWRPGIYDVIFCRNVIMYSTPEITREVISRITRSLAPGGFLFLGHAETLRGLSEDFHLLHTHGTFYYKRKADLLDRPPGIATEATWVEAVRSSSERIHSLQYREPSPEPPVTRTPDLNLAIGLLEKERYSEALDLLRGVPPESSEDPDLLVLRAVLLTHRGRFGEAERVCDTLTRHEGLSATAHYLLGLCREGVGDRSGAAQQYRMAVELDPSLSFSRLHLGLLARRRDDNDEARRELEQAVALLHEEAAPRVLLFGGGFTREGLIALCRAELAQLGGDR